MSQPTTQPTSPFEQPALLRIAPVVRNRQAESPVFRFRTMAGDESWMITRFDEAKEFFADPRLTRSHPDPENAPKVTNSALLDGSEWGYPDSEAEQQAEAVMRTVLSKSFSAKRMAELTPRIEALADDLLTTMTSSGSPADLSELVARPLPLLVICELLGVPYDERAQFQEWSVAAADPVDAERSRGAFESLYGYMAKLLADRRADPAEDVMSDLAAACESAAFTEFQAIIIAIGLLFAGHATTVVAIQWGVLHLLADPAQWTALSRDEALLPAAVEEILRTGLSGGEFLARYARSDIEIGGVTIRAGEAVVINVVAANHDPSAFADPDRFDATRSPNPHLAFGHGAHMCVGRSLARVELRVLFGLLLRRFPSLRLATPPAAIRLNENPVVGGVRELPVAW
jgi:pentalenolactone synthase